MRITLNDLPTSMTKKMADRTTFDSAMPLSYIASHYPDVRKCSSGISNPRPGLTPGTALRAVGSGINKKQISTNLTTFLFIEVISKVTK